MYVLSIFNNVQGEETNRLTIVLETQHVSVPTATVHIHYLVTHQLLHHSGHILILCVACTNSTNLVSG